MRRAKYRRFIAVILACGTLAAGGAEARPLKDELSQLLLTHPQIREAKNLLDAAGYEVDRAYAPFLPSVNLTTGKGFEYVDSPSRRENEQAPSRLSNEQATLELRYNLFDGFRKDAGHRIASAGQEIADLNLRNTQQSILFVGLRTYWQLRLALKQLRIDREAEATAAQQLTSLQATEGTQSTEIDTIRARGRFYAARSARITSENQVTDLVSEYERVFGHPPIPETMEDLPDVSQELPESLASSVEIALAENPGFQTSRREIVRADESVRQAEAAYYPELNLVGTANWENNLDATRGIARDLNVILRGTWQLFDGFSSAAGVSSAAAQRAAAKNRNRFTYRQVIQDVTRIWNQIELNKNQVDVWRRSVRNARDAIKGLESLVEQGRETQLAVLDGKVDLFNAQRQLNQFVGLRDLAQYRLLLIMGWLTPDMMALDRVDAPLADVEGEEQEDDGPVDLPGVDAPVFRPQPDARLDDVAPLNDVANISETPGFKQVDTVAERSVPETPTALGPEFYGDTGAGTVLSHDVSFD